MSRISHVEMDEIVDFVVSHYVYKATDRKRIKWMIAQHAEYDTIMAVRDAKGEIVAVCRWNILPTGTDAVILDIVIRPDHRKRSMMHRMLRKGLSMYPGVKYLIFERQDKGKAFKKIPVKWLLKRRF